MTKTPKPQLEHSRAPTNLKLALLWTSLMFLYIYNDYFGMYGSTTIANMQAGQMGPLGESTDQVMLGVSLMLAVPALMIALSVLLAPNVSRWLNVLLGVLYTFVEVMTLFGARLSYQALVVLEIAVTATIVWHALRWRRA